MVMIMDIDCVLCDVLTELLCIIYANICLQSVAGFSIFKLLLTQFSFVTFLLPK